MIMWQENISLHYFSCQHNTIYHTCSKKRSHSICTSHYIYTGMILSKLDFIVILIGNYIAILHGIIRLHNYIENNKASNLIPVHVTRYIWYLSRHNITPTPRVNDHNAFPKKSYNDEIINKIFTTYKLENITNV